MIHAPANGNSGHGFKFLPILGKYVKHQLEKTPDRFTPLWKWRSVEEGKKCNGLEEGEAGPREMSRLELAKRKDARHVHITSLNFAN